MMDLTSVVNYLTDNTKKVSSKAIFILLGICLIFIIDNSLSFSYYYNISKKTESLKSISETLKDTLLDEKERKLLIDLRGNIISHKTLKDKSFDYLTNFKFDDSQENKIEEIKTDSRNNVIHFITSSWWLILGGVVFIIVIPFVIFKKGTSILNLLLGFIFMEGFFYLLSLILSKLFSFIPLIMNKPIINYVINFILSSSLLWLILKINKKNNS